MQQMFNTLKPKEYEAHNQKDLKNVAPKPLTNDGA